MNRKHLLFITIILALGAFFRIFMINQLPGGLFPDEAAEGLDAQNIMKGFNQPFYERGNGREALYYYMLVPIIKIFGDGFWQPHLLSAIIGILSIIAVYLLASKMYDKHTGLIASFLMAVGTWHIVLSRTAFRANLIPIFLSMTVYFIVRVVQAQSNRDRIWSAIFAGAFFAGGFYTYIAYRIIVAILGFIAIFLFFADRKQNFIWLKTYYKSLLIGIASFFVVFAPLGHYFITHEGSFVGRSSQVSVFNEELNKGDLFGTIVDVAQKSVVAYFHNGDLNWRHNLSGSPFLSPLVSPFFGIALLLLSLITVKFLWQSLRGRQNMPDLKHVVIIGLFWGMLVPVITTAEGIPHGLRAVGTVPATYILAAIGLVGFAKLVEKVWHYEWMDKVYMVVVALYFATLTFTAYTQYFIIAKSSSQNAYAFRSDLTAVSKYLNDNPEKERNYLVLDLFSVQTVEYLTARNNQPYIIVDPENSYKLRVKDGDRIIFPASTIYDTIKFNETHKKYKLDITNDSIGNTDMYVYEAQGSQDEPSFSQNSDKSFWALNLKDKVYLSWQNQSFRTWTIRISQCTDASCKEQKVVKTNKQNDYLANNDHIDIDGTKSDLYYTAQGFDNSGGLIKDFGVLKINRYK